MQTKFALFEALCEPQLNFIESFEKILGEVSQINIEKKKFIKTTNNEQEGQEQCIRKQSTEEKFCNLDQYELMEINIINILINFLFNIPGKNKNIMMLYTLALVKNYILSKAQKNKEYPLLNELCNILMYKRNFGTKYEVC